MNNLLEHASRQKSKDILMLEIRRLQTEMINLEKKLSTNEETCVPKATSNTTIKCYTVKLNNYAWDQTNEFIKLYVTLSNVQSLPKEAVICHFKDRSIDLHVQGLENKNYELTINNLCEDIDPKKSYVKVKTDMIIIYLSKKAKRSWSCVTSVEKRLKDTKDSSLPNVGDNDDPNATLMNMMKKMYQEGDDDMKKMIAKAWTEGQDKKAGSLPKFDDNM